MFFFVHIEQFDSARGIFSTAQGLDNVLCLSCYTSTSSSCESQCTARSLWS